MRCYVQPFKNFWGKKDNRSFYTTLLLSFLITSLTSSLLLTGFLAVNYLTSMVTTTKDYNNQILSQTNYAIDQLNKNVENLYFSLMNNNKVTAFLSLSNAESTIPVLAGRELDNQLMVLSYVESIYLYNESLDLLYSSKNGYQQSLAECNETELTDCLNDSDFLNSHAGQPIAARQNQDTNSAEIFSYYFPDFYAASEGKTNAVVINVYVSSLTNSISSMKKLTAGTESSFILLDKDNSYLTGVLSPDAEKDSYWVNSALQEISSKSSSDSSFIRVNDISYFLIRTDTNAYQWKLFNFIPSKIIFQDILSTVVISSLILTGVLLFSFFICMYFARRLNGPVEMLALILNGKQTAAKPSSVSHPREFRMMLSAVSSLQNNNRQLRSMQQKSKYSLTQSCLNELVTNRKQDSPTLMLQKLESLNLTYLKKEKLCMAVFKIDNYQQFLASHNSEELWVLRFSVVNIIEELASSAFTCNAFSLDDDKFVLLISCDSEDTSSFENQITSIWSLIQENISFYLNFTVTVAYSTLFQGLDRLPIVYKNMRNSLLLKMRYGHCSIIDPYQTDELSDETFQLSYRMTSHLIDRLAYGQQAAAWSTYESLTDKLFHCDYSEIMSTIIHLVHSIYERLSEKYPMLKDDMTKALKFFLSELENAEIGEDIQNLAREFFEDICTSIQRMKENPAQQNSSIVAEKVSQIITQNYTDPSLCLCSIAEEIGLSTNYTGHIFKQHTQKSVSQYILEVRMDQLAVYLKTSSLSLNTILEKVGLEKNNYFYTRFKNYFGMSLNEYRQQFQPSSANEE